MKEEEKKLLEGASKTSETGTGIISIFWILMCLVMLFRLIDSFGLIPDDKKPNENYNTKLNCELKPLCERYAKTRLECAVAGSYSQCMEIKLGEKNFPRLSYECAEDGTISGHRNDTPGSLQCFFVRNFWK